MKIKHFSGFLLTGNNAHFLIEYYNKIYFQTVYLSKFGKILKNKLNKILHNKLNINCSFITFIVFFFVRILVFKLI